MLAGGTLQTQVQFQQMRSLLLFWSNIFLLVPILNNLFLRFYFERCMYLNLHYMNSFTGAYGTGFALKKAISWSFRVFLA
jgi:hypothetical protein